MTLHRSEGTITLPHPPQALSRVFDAHHLTPLQSPPQPPPTLSKPLPTPVAQGVKETAEVLHGKPQASIHGPQPRVLVLALQSLLIVLVLATAARRGLGAGLAGVDPAVGAPEVKGLNQQHVEHGNLRKRT